GFAALEVSAVATVTGGIYANVSVELVDPANSSHVYLDDMINNLDALSFVFNVSGKLYASATIEVTAEVPGGPSVTLFSYELARVTLLDYDPLPPAAGTVPSVIIDVTDQHTLLIDPAKTSVVGEVTISPFHNVPLVIGGHTV